MGGRKEWVDERMEEKVARGWEGPQAEARPVTVRRMGTTLSSRTETEIVSNAKPKRLVLSYRNRRSRQALG